MVVFKRIVLAGAGGMLGSEFAASMPKHSELLVLGKSDLDIFKHRELQQRIRRFEADLILNCAADTDVEGAELNRERCIAANTILPSLLAKSATAAGAKMVHFSSTGCYGSWKKAPYAELDRLEPTTVHHLAKAAGEAEVWRHAQSPLILRLGWLFGGQPQHRDFVRARLRDITCAPEIAADPTQVGNPTSVKAVVHQVWHLLNEDIAGTLNCTGEETVSRLEYVQAIIDSAQSNTRITPKKFNRRAPVSPNEAATCEMLGIWKKNVMEPWRQSLKNFVESCLHPKA